MILEIDNVELSFDNRRILSGVYLKAETGKVTALLGRNGCGKTSLLRILFGSLNPKYGNVRIDSAHQRKKLYKGSFTAYLPQHQLLPENIELSRAFGFFDTAWDKFINDFPSFKIYEKTKTGMISSGELRVVETYLILQSEKKIILLDEPFSFISPIYVEKIKILIQLKKKKSVIVITDHFYRDILQISDTVYFLKDGYSKVIRSKEDLAHEGYLNLGS